MQREQVHCPRAGQQNSLSNSESFSRWRRRAVPASSGTCCAGGGLTQLQANFSCSDLLRQCEVSGSRETANGSVCAVTTVLTRTRLAPGSRAPE